ncbi:MAG: HAMP domain-containing sensor histidine kinase [Eubacteriales bacterium]|nr:HAMP domain-containing sensor histidine kinase [Eubacteriales bacterium]
MKFRTKISAAAVGLLLLLSQIFSVWSLTETQKQMIENIVESEWQALDEDVNRFQSEMNAKNLEDTSFIKAVGRMRFIAAYSTDAVLYYNGEEIANSTPYEFAVESLSGNAVEPERNQTFLETVNGKHLLILYKDAIVYSGTDRFRILHYRDITGIYQENEAMFLKGVGVALLLALLLLAVLTGIIRRIFRPFDRMRDAANVIANGNYGVRIPNPGTDEVGEVAASFNRMADKVEEHIGELEEMNEKQRQLLGALAHELKTPMTGIQGYAELLQRVKLSPKKQADALGYIEEECRRLSRLSVKMLQLVELSGEDAIEKKPVALSELFGRVKEITHYSLKEKNLRLEVDLSNACEIQGDEDLLLSFLTNLIDNARKASQPGMAIRLTGSAEGIFVEDQGNGIPQEEIARITEPFYMVDKSRARKEGGAGLGLALCSQIARLHGGKLEIASGEGQGTRIGLRYNLVTSR